MTIIGIDPGPTHSGFAAWDRQESRVLASGAETPNLELLRVVLPALLRSSRDARGVDLAVERVACYGATVGNPVFETVFFSGRLAEWWQQTTGREAIRLTFGDVALHHCHSRRAKESQVRQVLLDRFGGKGTKGQPGAFYAVSSHGWSAAALAIAVAEQQQEAVERTA